MVQSLSLSGRKKRNNNNTNNNSNNNNNYYNNNNKKNMPQMLRWQILATYTNVVYHY